MDFLTFDHEHGCIARFPEYVDGHASAIALLELSQEHELLVIDLSKSVVVVAAWWRVFEQLKNVAQQNERFVAVVADDFHRDTAKVLDIHLNWASNVENAFAALTVGAEIRKALAKTIGDPPTTEEQHANMRKWVMDNFPSVTDVTFTPLPKGTLNEDGMPVDTTMRFEVPAQWPNKKQ